MFCSPVCASSTQNGPYKVALALYPPSESNLLSQEFDRTASCAAGCRWAAGGRSGGRHSRRSAWEPCCAAHSPWASPGGQCRPEGPLEGKGPTSQARSCRNAKIDVCWFFMLFGLLKYQEWWGSVGGCCFLGIFFCFSFCFVKKNQALVCDSPLGW